VKEKRAHGQDVTPASGALERAILLAQRFGGLAGEATMTVRPRDDTERTIRGPAVVEVRSHSNQRFQHGHRRLDVQNTFLLGPAGALAVLDTFPDRDTQILVQGNKPVVVR
jgi:hypothetical protein